MRVFAHPEKKDSDNERTDENHILVSICEPEHQQYSKKANNRRAKPDQYPDDENQTDKDLH